MGGGASRRAWRVTREPGLRGAMSSARDMWSYGRVSAAPDMDRKEAERMHVKTDRLSGWQVTHDPQ